jgi:hypothetical protein
MNSNLKQADRRKRKYGIDDLQMKIMLERQLHKCAICAHPISYNTLRVDHDHNINDPNDDSVRGLLCNNCNVLLGFAKDDITILQNAIDYLKKTKKTWF